MKFPKNTFIFEKLLISAFKEGLKKGYSEILPAKLESKEQFLIENFIKDCGLKHSYEELSPEVTLIEKTCDNCEGSWHVCPRMGTSTFCSSWNLERKRKQ